MCLKSFLALSRRQRNMKGVKLAEGTNFGTAEEISHVLCLHLRADILCSRSSCSLRKSFITTVVGATVFL